MPESPANRTASQASAAPSSAASEQPMVNPEIQQVAMMPAHEYKARQQAKVFEEAEKIQSQETRAGGDFIVNGEHVDANGNPFKDADKKE
jgi:hypothetical protein